MGLKSFLKRRVLNVYGQELLTALKHKDVAEYMLSASIAKLRGRQRRILVRLEAEESESEEKSDPQSKKYIFSGKKVAERLAERLNRRTNYELSHPLDAAGQKNLIPIVFICDDHYATPTGVAITSLLCNKNENTRYEITVLGRQLSQENIRLLSSLSPDVHVLACDERKSAPYANTHVYVSEAALLKFDIPQLLPQWDKILYLDSDVLILDDLTKLYSTDLTEHYAAAVKDLLGAHFGFHTRTGLSAYFNSGIMLLNTKKMREEKISEKLFENKANDPWKLLMDQDTFNVTFAENVVWLPPRYNLMYGNNAASGWSISQMAEFYDVTPKQMIDTMQNPVIQHLSSQLKPWDSPRAAKYQEYKQYRLLFEMYLKKRQS